MLSFTAGINACLLPKEKRSSGGCAEIMAFGGVKFLDKKIPFSARLIKGASED